MRDYFCQAPLVYQALCRLSLGEAQVSAGHLEEAQALAEGVLALAREHQGRGHQACRRPRRCCLVVLGRNNPSLYTVNGRPLYVHLNGLAIVLLK